MVCMDTQVVVVVEQSNFVFFLFHAANGRSPSKWEPTVTEHSEGFRQETAVRREKYAWLLSGGWASRV